MVIAAVWMMGCKDPWDEHDAVGDKAITKSLFTQIQANPDLSEFEALLVSTGYDQVLQTSKVFTVWAPNNTALAGISEDITGDSAARAMFVANHIAYQAYTTQTDEAIMRIKMVNGKYNVYDRSAQQLGAAHITNGNTMAGNGVLHVLDTRIEPQPNLWEQVMTMEGTAHMTDFLKNLTTQVFVDTLADQIGINPDTGQPIYDTLSGLVEINYFLRNIEDLSDEDTVFTFFMLTDDAFDAAREKLAPYFQDTTVAASYFYSAWNLIKDLVVKGAYEPQGLPTPLYSADSVVIQVLQDAIVSTQTLSNGIVYVLNTLDFALTEKIRPIVIEGEYPIGFSHDRASNVFYRQRAWASNQMDLEARNHSTAEFSVYYRARQMCSMKYEVYWRAVNDFEDSFWQRVRLDSISGTMINDQEVVPYTYEEVLLGDFTRTYYGTQILLLQSANTTSNRWNPLVLDYLKLVPVFEE